MHLLIVDYSSDAERKRIEYIFNKYESEVGEIEKITGISRIVRDNDIEKLLSELYLRTPPDGVKVYKLSEFSTKSALSSNKIEMDFSGKIEAVESFISYLLAQRKAVFSRKVGDNFKLYTSTTRKGYAELIVGIFENEGKVSVEIEIHTEEPNMSYIINFFTEQLELFRKSSAR